MNIIEHRFVELRAEPESRKIAGVAITYNDLAKLPWGLERIAAGAFGDVKSLDVIMNLQHNRAMPLARTTGGGLQLQDDDDALRVEAELPATRMADDALTMVQSGVLRGLSIEFKATNEHRQGNVRVIDRARLVGVSLVDTPAYPRSMVEARMKQMDRYSRRVWL